MTKTAYRRKGLFGAYSSRGLGIHDHHGGSMGTGRQTGKVLAQNGIAHVQVHKQETESTLGVF